MKWNEENKNKKSWYTSYKIMIVQNNINKLSQMKVYDRTAVCVLRTLKVKNTDRAKKISGTERSHT